MAKLDPEREARLAASLRDNLKRRKAQAREMEGKSPPIYPGEGRGPAQPDEPDPGLRRGGESL